MPSLLKGLNIDFFLILVLPIFLFAHKVNLFLDLKDNNLYINSYFANAKPCMEL